MTPICPNRKIEWFLCKMKMQRARLPIFSYQTKRREQGTPVANDSHLWPREWGPCLWQRLRSERIWILVDIIELLMALCLEPFLPPVFQLENLQIDLVCNPLWMRFCNCLYMFFFPFKKKWQNILKIFCFLVASFIHIALHQKIIEYVFDFETTFENSP